MNLMPSVFCVLLLALLAGCHAGPEIPTPLTEEADLRAAVGRMVRVEGEIWLDKPGLFVQVKAQPFVPVYLLEAPQLQAMLDYALIDEIVQVEGRRVSVIGRLEWEPPGPPVEKPVDAGPLWSPPHRFENGRYVMRQVWWQVLPDVADDQHLPNVPPHLVNFRDDSRHWGHGGGQLATDSRQMFDNIDRYPILRAVLLDPRSDPQVLELAIERALLVAGPTRVFGDVKRDAADHPTLFSRGLRRQLLQRANEPHVWVDESAFIEQSDMPRADARRVFDQMITRVREGADFDDVYVQTWREHQYVDDTMVLTRVGNYGNFVLSQGKPDAKPYRWLEVPQDHVTRLLATEPGDMVMLQDDREDDPSLILYHVREVYRPE